MTYYSLGLAQINLKMVECSCCVVILFLLYISTVSQKMPISWIYTYPYFETYLVEMYTSGETKIPLSKLR